MNKAVGLRRGSGTTKFVEWLAYSAAFVRSTSSPSDGVSGIKICNEAAFFDNNHSTAVWILSRDSKDLQ
jgi:hypothetical protein